MFNFSRNRSAFQVRSVERDLNNDQARLKSILGTVDKVIHDIEVEQAGLKRRFAKTLEVASNTIGNSSDEYLTRDSAREQHQKSINSDIRYLESRLGQLNQNYEFYVSFKRLLCSATQV